MAKIFISDFPDILLEWHPTKNGDLRPETTNACSYDRFWWKCYKGKWPDGTSADDHEWEAVAISRVRQHAGCPCCGGRKTVPSNCLAVTHPHLIKEWHPTKNGDLTPYNLLSGGRQKIWWKCHNGKWPDGTFADDHEWESTVYGRVSKNIICPCCSGKKVVPSNCLAATHSHLIKEWHPIKNGDLTPYNFTRGSNKKIWWKCYNGKWPDGTFADDHEREISVSHRTTGNKCCICAGQKVVPSNCLATTHPNLVTEWDSAKNNDFSPYNVKAGSDRKLPWKCKVCENEWSARVANRTVLNRGCPRCNESKGEQCIAKYLTSNNIPYEFQCKCKNSRVSFDFSVFVKGEFWYIEYQGRQHYQPCPFSSKENVKYKKFCENIRRDENKRRFCANNKIKLLEIPYWDYDRINVILDDFFADLTPVDGEE